MANFAGEPGKGLSNQRAVSKNMMNCAFKTRNCVSKLMDFVFEMENCARWFFARGYDMVKPMLNASTVSRK